MSCTVVDEDGPRAVLSADEIEAFREAFDHFDKDGSGLISETELETVLTEFGQRPTKHEMRGMIEEVDGDHNGEVDFDEFLTMMNMYAAKASKIAELHAPDPAPFIANALNQRIGLTKRGLLEQVRAMLEGEVAGTAERAIRTDSGKDFFRAEMKKGTAFVVSQLGRSFDELQRSVAGILELKDRKQADGIVASRAQSFVQAATAVMAAKGKAREDARLLQARSEQESDALLRRARDERRAVDTRTQGQVSRLSAKLDRAERARAGEEAARAARERDVMRLEVGARLSTTRAARCCTSKHHALTVCLFLHLQAALAAARAENGRLREEAGAEAARVGGALHTATAELELAERQGAALQEALAEMDAAALADATSIARLKLECRSWRQCFLQLRDAKDTFNAVVADSRVTNPEHLNLERIQVRRRRGGQGRTVSPPPPAPLPSAH
jgi:hypothetical protein